MADNGVVNPPRDKAELLLLRFSEMERERKNWTDKAETWALAERLGGAALVALTAEHTHSCYLGERSLRHDWGYGCGSCPACELRRQGWDAWRAAA